MAVTPGPKELKLGKNLSSGQADALRNILHDCSNAFSWNEFDVGRARSYEVDIVPKSDAIPFRCPPPRLPVAMREEAKRQIGALLRVGIIQRSSSPWSSRYHLVRKKNGSYRMVQDLRELNKRSIGCGYPMPRIEDVVEMLSGAPFVSTLDLRWGY